MGGQHPSLCRQRREQRQRGGTALAASEQRRRPRGPHLWCRLGPPAGAWIHVSEHPPRLVLHRPQRQLPQPRLPLARRAAGAGLQAGGAAQRSAEVGGTTALPWRCAVCAAAGCLWLPAAGGRAAAGCAAAGRARWGCRGPASRATRGPSRWATPPRGPTASSASCGQGRRRATMMSVTHQPASLAAMPRGQAEGQVRAGRQARAGGATARTACPPRMRRAKPGQRRPLTCHTRSRRGAGRRAARRPLPGTAP